LSANASGAPCRPANSPNEGFAGMMAAATRGVRALAATEDLDAFAARTNLTLPARLATLLDALVFCISTFFCFAAWAGMLTKVQAQASMETICIKRFTTGLSVEVIHSTPVQNQFNRSVVKSKR
jgi:hypothetical protein